MSTSFYNEVEAAGGISRAKNYRIEDPLENLKVKIIIREISRISTRQQIEQKPYEDTIELSWQQKIFGPGDIGDYIRNKNSAWGSPYQRDNRRHLAHLEKDKTTPESLLEEVMLYTVIEKEEYHHNKTPLTKGTTYPLESYLGQAISNKDGSSSSTSKNHKIGQRLRREKAVKNMFIYLATDVEVDNIKQNKFYNIQEHYHEHLLCAIRLDQDGLLEMSPGFSDIVSESSLGRLSTSGSGQPSSLFMDDLSILAGIRKGFLIQTYRLRTKQGVEYEYVIQNVNELTIPHEIQELEIESLNRDMKNAEDSRGIRETQEWRQDPPLHPHTASLAVYAEIVSAFGFQDQKVFVNYQVSIPEKWKVRIGDVNDGMNSARVKEADFVQEDRDFTDCRGMMGGITQTALPKMMKGYYDELKQNYTSERSSSPTVHTIKQKRHYNTVVADDLTLDDFSRFLIGTIFFLTTCLALLLGWESAVWIAPALIIFFAIGSGPPADFQPQIIQVSSKVPVPLWRSFLAPLAQPVAYFGHLFSLSFDITELTLQDLPRKSDMSGIGSSTDSITIYFQVYSVHWFNRISLTGVGYTTIPNKTGAFDITVPTWKPAGGIHAQMCEYFLSGGLKLKDNRFVKSPNDSTFKSDSRLGVLTETSGQIRFRFNTILLDSTSVYDVSPQVLSHSQKPPQLLRRTVEDILQSFRNSTVLSSQPDISSVAQLAMPTGQQRAPLAPATSTFTSQTGLSFSWRSRSGRFGSKGASQEDVKNVLAKVRARSAARKETKASVDNPRTDFRRGGTVRPPTRVPGSTRFADVDNSTKGQMEQRRSLEDVLGVQEGTALSPIHGTPRSDEFNEASVAGGVGGIGSSSAQVQNQSSMQSLSFALSPDAQEYRKVPVTNSSDDKEEDEEQSDTDALLFGLGETSTDGVSPMKANSSAMRLNYSHREEEG